MKGFLEKPEDRAPAVRALFKAAGGKLLHYYVTFGEYDFLVVAEADDVSDVLAGLLTAAGTGGVSDLKTTLAVSTSDMKKSAQKAQAMVEKFRPAGG